MNKVTVSSTPVLRASLVWGMGIGAATLVIAAIVGYLTAQGPGLWSGVVGALVGIVFPALTAVSILVANRWYGTPIFLQVFFGVVMGAWILKFVLVIVLLLVLSGMDWVVPLVFYFSLLATAVASLVIDLLVMRSVRVPSASEVTLPEENPED